MSIPNYICPYCATFSLTPNKGFECSNCGSRPKTRHLRITHDYAGHVYLYGHLYREDYQRQVDENGDVNVKYCLEPGSIYQFIGLAMLSGVIGGLTYDLVKNATEKIIKSYNSYFDTSETVTDQELFDIFKSFEIFIKHSDKIDTKVMESIYEEMLAHETGKHAEKIFKNVLNHEMTMSPLEKENIKRAYFKLVKKVSKDLNRKISKMKEAESESFDNYWGNIKIE